MADGLQSSLLMFIFKTPIKRSGKLIFRWTTLIESLGIIGPSPYLHPRNAA